MAHSPRILAFAGSTRRDSYNKKLVRIAAQGARDAGAEVTVVDLNEFPMPLFDEDLEAEEGTPEPAHAFKSLLAHQDGVLISCPEYNSSITGVLKNAIDWASRPADDEAPLIAFKGKVVGLMATSPGALGGLRGLVHVRAILGNLGMIVLPDQVAIPKAFEAFAEDGSLVNERKQKQVTDIARAVVETRGKTGAVVNSEHTERVRPSILFKV